MDLWAFSRSFSRSFVFVTFIVRIIQEVGWKWRILFASSWLLTPCSWAKDCGLVGFHLLLALHDDVASNHGLIEVHCEQFSRVKRLLGSRFTFAALWLEASNCADVTFSDGVIVKVQTTLLAEDVTAFVHFVTVLTFLGLEADSTVVRAGIEDGLLGLCIELLQRCLELGWNVELAVTELVDGLLKVIDVNVENLTLAVLLPERCCSILQLEDLLRHKP